MPTLHKYLHVIVFLVLIVWIAVLNVGPFAVGWPFPFADNRGFPWLYKAILHSIVNIVPCTLILSLCMVPFAYDSKRSFSVGNIMMFTTAACIGFLLLKPSYLANYQAGDHLFIVLLTAFAMNGILTWLVSVVSPYVDFPDWRKPERSKGHELDLD